MVHSINEREHILMKIVQAFTILYARHRLANLSCFRRFLCECLITFIIQKCSLYRNFVYFHLIFFLFRITL